MDKSAIRNFAVWARRKLIDDIMQKAYEIGISENDIKEPEVITSDTLIINNISLKKYQIKQRQQLVSRIRDKGFHEVVEEVAYTWFNRFIALRFMEVNEYLPTGVRVLSSIEKGKNEPDIINEALNIDLDLDKELVYKLQDENNTEDLYKYLIVKQCNALNEILPGLFEQIEDYTEILIPNNLLQDSSVIRRLVQDISEDDFRDQVEIIGWLYQYYISEKKDEVFDALKKNIKITKENIPAATQLFTPDWIVKYMVENSLGRLWQEGHPNEELKSSWKYYIEEAEQEKDVQKQLDAIREKSKKLKPEDIKVLDPAMGSGHILVYAFDILYDIYRSAGYSEKDIPKLILNNNLYGLDIDDRAAQLAYFAIMMKARSKNRRIFREKINLNICSIQESNDIPKEALQFLISPMEVELEKKIHREDIEYLVNVFENAKEYGSILQVRKLDFDIIEKRIEEIRTGVAQNMFELQFKNIILDKVPALIKQGKIMSQKYEILVTNPPYIGIRSMNSILAEYARKNFKHSKNDISTIFMETSMKSLKKDGFMAMINIPSWMFLSSYEELRKDIINSHVIMSLIHLGRGIFGSDFGTTTFVVRNTESVRYKGKYRKLFDKQGSVENVENLSIKFIDNPNEYNVAQRKFTLIDGSPIAYWVSDKVIEVFVKGIKLENIAEPRQGMATSDNDRFLRFWFEVKNSKIGFHFTNREEAKKSNLKWFPYNKGGGYRKWYGNNEYLINWENDGVEVKQFRDYKNATLSSNMGVAGLPYIFKNNITWSKVTIGEFSVRYLPSGYLFDVSGCSIYGEETTNKKLLALLNSKVITTLIKGISPTVNYEVGTIKKLPVYHLEKYNNDHIDECIQIAKQDWDSFETSWDFKRHPILVHNKDTNSIGSAFDNWSAFTLSQFYKLKSYEEDLNRIFIEIYELQGELSPEIEDKEVTIRKADRKRDIISFISFATGCMFGRYSIDAEGLIYAGEVWKDKWNIVDGQKRVKKIVKDDDGNIIEDTWIDATFIPDEDNIIPILDDEYFDDDIVSRFVNFVKVTFGKNTLEENLDYIAESLGKKGSETSKQTIRRYFLKDFYKDHIQTYQKKPIYWLFDSGKNDGFKALIYMHRYDEYTVAKVRTDYLHKLQRKYEAELKRLDIIIDSNVSEREKANARKKKEKIQKQVSECLQYDQVIAHVANQKISIDLDDGVSVNYAKFQGVEIPQGDGKKPLKADLLAKL